MKNVWKWGKEYTGVLAVTFTKFTAVGSNNTSVLNWQVADQVNNDHYEVEASTDANNYKVIGTVPSKQDASVYQFIDANPSLAKTNFYRIKEVDKDGKYIYSPVRYVKFDVSVISISPNPATSYIKVSSSIQNLQINIFDVTGRKVVTQILNSSSAQINIASLPKGVYTVIAYDNGTKVDSKKIVKQ